MVMRARAALKDGRIVDWNYDVWSNTHNMRPGDPAGVTLRGSWYLKQAKQPGPPRALAQPAGGGDRNAIPLYDLPRSRITSHLIKDMPLRVSALRTLGAYANVFAIESFMDELAEAAQADPVEFRLAHLKDPRAKAVIEAAAKAADWKPGRKRCVATGLGDRPDWLPLGAGGAAQGPPAAALANALTAATGKRIRELPLHPKRVKAALG